MKLKKSRTKPQVHIHKFTWEPALYSPDGIIQPVGPTMNFEVHFVVDQITIKDLRMLDEGFVTNNLRDSIKVISINGVVQELNETAFLAVLDELGKYMVSLASNV